MIEHQKTSGSPSPMAEPLAALLQVIAFFQGQKRKRPQQETVAAFLCDGAPGRT